MTYAEKLRDVRWQQVRLKRLEAEDWLCQDCTCASRTLHVHHTVYRAGWNPWDYPADELRVLCDECHKDRHNYQEYILSLLGICDPDSLIAALSFVRGRLDPDVENGLTRAIDNIAGKSDAVDYSIMAGMQSRSKPR